jgi:hypothetical protein
MAEQLTKLLSEFHEEGKVTDSQLEKLVRSIPDSELPNVIKDVSPYRLTIPGADKQTVSFSYTNMREEHMRDFMATSFIAYVYRMLKEYELPEEVPPVDLDEWKRDPTKADPPKTIKDPRLLALYAKNKEMMPVRYQISKFLDSLFKFDPDRHAVTHFRGNKGDSSRELFRTPELKAAVTAGNTVRKVVPKSHAPTVSDIDSKGRDPVTPIELTTTTVIPSSDMFARFDRYREEHREELLAMTHNLYGTRPDMDIAVNVYAIHNSPEEAKLFRHKHMDNVIAPITNIQMNRWALLGAYRENRERVDFLSRQTEVLKAMIDAREQQSHVATDIMKKRAKNKKKESVKEMGPDHPEFTRWAKDNRPSVEGMGGEYLGTFPEEKRTRPEGKAEEKSEDEAKMSKRVVRDGVGDCPDDHVEVSVYDVRDGGSDVKVSTIYNPVEAPAAKS